MTIVPFPTRRWNIKALLLCHIIVALMVSTWLWPVTRPAWEALDVWFFKLLNGTLRGHPTWQAFWALANHKLADWVEDFFVLGFFIAYVRKSPQKLRSVASLLFIILYIAAIIYYVNCILFRETLRIEHPSPTLVVDNCVRLSHEIDWLKIKDSSSRSFPAYHGTTAVLFAASYTILAGRRLGFYASLYATFLCLPRLIAGSHWLSDIIVGSGSLTLLFLSWAFCTPFSQKCIDLFERSFQWCRLNSKKIFIK